ncbi:putative RNA-directed DNA polymerase from transposon X-element [Stylophora pistillata]|uniref:Putative RNA-directed DNA polymerase from transposon X-element n=1 Tax=Stylophora pistillata TaxID=50429 RepID=A0A2B4SN78_STYPI|nr:putative RNA-directed DNA polymerase from transposon X-element [Stylophora pistillata]
MVLEPTRGNNILDLVLTNNSDMVCGTEGSVWTFSWSTMTIFGYLRTTHMADYTAVGGSAQGAVEMTACICSDTIISDLTLDESTVLAALKALEVGKATGPDEIPAKLLKETASACKIFNKSLRLGSFPSDWKRAKVVNVHKKGARDHVENYLPISLLPIVSKVFKRCVLNGIKDQLYQAISPKQHGFYTGISRVTNLLEALDHIGSLLDSGSQVDTIYLDMSKAFDKVSHRHLIHKLIQTAGVHNRSTDSPAVLRRHHALQSHVRNREEANKNFTLLHVYFGSDLFSHPEETFDVSVVEDFSSDHLAVSFSLFTKLKRMKKSGRSVYNLKKADLSGLKSALRNLSWDTVFVDNDIDASTACWYDMFLSCVDEFVAKMVIKDAK